MDYLCEHGRFFFNKLSTRISSFLLAKSAVGNVDSDQVAFG